MFSGNLSSENNSPIPNRTRTSRSIRSSRSTSASSSRREQTILKREENVFTLQAFAYEPEDEDDSFSSPVKNFTKRSHRKTHSGNDDNSFMTHDSNLIISAAKCSIARSLEIEEMIDSGLINHQQLEAQKQIMNMSPDSKKQYFSNSKGHKANKQQIQTQTQTGRATNR